MTPSLNRAHFIAGTEGLAAVATHAPAQRFSPDWGRLPEAPGVSFLLLANASRELEGLAAPAPAPVPAALPPVGVSWGRLMDRTRAPSIAAACGDSSTDSLTGTTWCHELPQRRRDPDSVHIHSQHDKNPPLRAKIADPSASSPTALLHMYICRCNTSQFPHNPPQRDFVLCEHLHVAV